MVKDDAGNIWLTEKFRSVDLHEIFAKHDRKSDRFVKYKINLNGAGMNRSIFADSGNTIWIATDGAGLYYHDFRSNNTKNYLNAHVDHQVHSRQNSITHLKDLGTTLLLTTQEGLWIFDKQLKSFTRPACPPLDSAVLYHSVFREILTSPHVKEKNTWLRTQSGLIMLDSNFSVTRKFDFPEGIIPTSRWGRDNEGVFWFIVSTTNDAGLVRYDPKNNSFISLTDNPKIIGSLSSVHVYDVMVDKDQNVWVTTNHGVSVLRRQHLKFYNTKVDKVFGNYIYRSSDTEYSIITSANQILMAKIIPGRLDLLDFRPVPVSLDNYWLKFWKGKDTFWICTANGIRGYPINPKTGMFGLHPSVTLQHIQENEYSIRSNIVTNVWEDDHENLWVSHLYLGVDQVRLNLPYGSEGSVVRHDFGGGINCFFYPENEKSFWVMYDKYLDLVHLQGTSINPKRERIMRPNEQVYSMLKTSNGNILLGGSNSIYEAIKVGDKYTPTKTPIMNNVLVGAAYEDNFGRLWIYGGNRLLCHDRKEGYTTVFDEREGINHFRAALMAWMHKTSSGALLMASVDGITAFDPSEFQPIRVKTSPVLTSLEINHSRVTGSKLANDHAFTIPSDISVLDELTIDYTHNNFTLEFSAMEMTAPEKNLYKHKLEGYDKDWIETDYKNRSATYTNLDAGHYTFKVMASNHHGIWSDQEKTLSVVVLPPPWKTTWAYTGYGLLFIGLLYGARKTIVQRERLKSNLKLARVEQEKEHFELEKAKEVDRVKTSFFTNISHEFRTPLTLIKGPVQDMLEQFKDDPRILARLKLVQRNSDLLLRLINQLLDLAKLESGSLKVEKSGGELFSFIRAITSSFESFARQKNISLLVEVPTSLQSANFDKDKLETILINLINNAIKFTPGGGNVKIYATVDETGEKFHAKPQSRKGMLSLRVSDTGIGIPEEHQSKIFERFHQVSEAHREVGTGIGLSLVKELVALMNGTISVRSNPGEGSEFMVSLPIEIFDAEQEIIPVEYSTRYQIPGTSNQKRSNIEHPILNDEVDSGKPHVLVVEDNADLRSFIIDSLGSEFHFLEAGDGKQGLDIATREVPDLIISDVMMPEMDGITMAGKIKSDVRTSHIPLILLTAKSTEESKLSGLQSGADDYLTKPFNKQELLLKVRNSVLRQQKLREKLRVELISSVPTEQVMSADEQFLMKVKETILEQLSNEQLSVESLAEDIGLSRVQLYRKVSALTGMSVNELIRKLRLQKAALLLGQNWGPVSQVAYEVGFSNLSYFSKVFKEEFGVLPSEYEKQ